MSASWFISTVSVNVSVHSVFLSALYLGHLMHRFAISDLDWHRIRLNLDSKCRTAYRRKIKGQPLSVKAFREQRPPSEFFGYGNSSIDVGDDKQLHIQEVCFFFNNFLLQCRVVSIRESTTYLFRACRDPHELFFLNRSMQSHAVIFMLQ